MYERRKTMSTEQCDLESQMATALLTADDLGQAVIEIKDLDGTILLMGVVETEEDRLKVEALAKVQEGVEEVISELRVAGLWGVDAFKRN
jgi:osmotically-inducible protein OsmY